ncbi:MAG: sialidase family protein [Planctomycetota bacterium]|nr:sialidase family protein [Planctomycetota bacterium]
MERYVAIDNVCAWPNLTLMPDNSVTATIFNQPCHGEWEGDVEVWGSEDQGRTWKLRGVPAPHAPGTNRMNVAAGLAKNGDLIVLSSGWGSRPKPPQKAHHDGTAKCLSPWVCRSSDGGRTWTHVDKFPEAPEPDMMALVPFGDILRCADGSLGVSCYTGRLGDQAYKYNSSYFFRSADDGKTWGPGVFIAKGNHNETAPFHLGKGKWIAAVRTLDPANMVISRSDDDGKTWAVGAELTRSAEHPGDLIRLADGRLLLTFGVRRKEEWAIAAKVSSDEGATWSHAATLTRLIESDLGYPSTVQFADGALCTAYYNSRNEVHHRYHMGSLVWKLSEFF